ncbi:MAG: hypothetical protein JSV91_06055 [Phycisphaerales bacterium]|nr:MAG: hypothetical protein JSV91_06055 [Phycisphaerales bacterium]
MHEKRNFILILLLLAAAAWAFTAFFVMPPDVWGAVWQKLISVVVVLGLGAWLVYALRIEDKLPNHLEERVGGVYYGADGLCFMPTIRVVDNQAQLSVYYQNRYENPAQAIVHIRPPEDSFIIRPGLHDVHFAFRAGGGDFGVIHQPIAVPEHLQGEVIEVQLAAVSYYPRSKGARLLKHAGIPCGSLLVDWGGSAFKTGVHEVSGEVQLENPITLRLAMPKSVNSFVTDAETWKQECIASGKETSAVSA